MKKTDNHDPLARFEDAMKELEAIVQKMERGDLRLEESLKLFERGMELTAQCRTSLDTAELKVKNLLERHTPPAPEAAADADDDA
ncbi:MAG TPA: exodeoxyribonuclease VII small subunit [Nevskiaceae bacterium]|nr:exodeoxyribonuclease VII small subunit [Nevskiaceae bacterium]